MDKTVYTALLLFFVLVAAPVPSSRAADATVQAQNAQTADKLKKEKPAAGKMQKAPAASSARQSPVKKQKNSLPFPPFGYFRQKTCKKSRKSRSRTQYTW